MIGRPDPPISLRSQLCWNRVARYSLKLACWLKVSVAGAADSGNWTAMLPASLLCFCALGVNVTPGGATGARPMGPDLAPIDIPDGVRWSTSVRDV